MRPAAFLLGLAGLATLGCRMDINRLRKNTPLDLETYEDLRVGETTLESALEKLGAPDVAEWKRFRDYLTWEQLDTTTLSFRLQLPLSFSGYRHNLFQYLDDFDQTNRIVLVFDEDHTLEDKRLILPEIYRDEPETTGLSRIHIAPRVEHSFFIGGDGGFADYDEAFAQGYLAGLELGLQPVPLVTVGVTGSFQRYRGQNVASSAGQLGYSDLDLYAGEVLLRLQLPFRLLLGLTDFEKIRSMLFEKDPRRFDGWNLYIEGSVGATLNQNVRLTIDGAAAGNVYDASWQLGTSAGAGIEYSWQHLSLRVGALFRSSDGLDEGDSPISMEAEAFQRWMGVVSLGLKF